MKEIAISTWNLIPVGLDLFFNGKPKKKEQNYHQINIFIIGNRKKLPRIDQRTGHQYPFAYNVSICHQRNKERAPEQFRREQGRK